MAAAAVLTLLAATTLQSEKFYPDDPLWTVPKPRNAEKVSKRKLNDYYDFFLNTFGRPGNRHPPGEPVRSLSANTLGEIPDSEWYTNRHAKKRMSLEELARGPNTGTGPSESGDWTIISAKNQGITPGFLIKDATGARFFIKFDPLENPEMATAADVIGAKLFYALGYHVPQNYIVHFPRSRLRLEPNTAYRDSFGKRRKMRERDVDEILRRVPQDEGGRYRAVASLFLEGEVVGEFRYHGTRRDDPNDIIPHEHRRELRGLFVFAAWLGHDDSRAINTLDTLVEADGRRFVRHHLIDFGSILGSASTSSNSARSGHQHLFEFKPSVAEVLSLGLWVPDWARVRYPDLPSVGRFECSIFDPERFKTEYPNPAFENRLPDDTYWAAKVVMSFTPEDIKAIVKTGEYSDPDAEKWIVDCLLVRRERIGRTYFAKVVPLENLAIREGRLVFDDLAVQYGFSKPREYDIQWFSFDNRSQQNTAVPGSGPAWPAELRDPTATPYFGAVVRIPNQHAALTAYFRHTPQGPQLVGVERTW